MALFPALKDAAIADPQGPLAMALFVQALVWINSMKLASVQKLDCQHAMAPFIQADDELAWTPATQIYIGDGWGLTAFHEHLLGLAYPSRRLVPFSVMRRSDTVSPKEMFTPGEPEPSEWGYRPGL